MNKWHLLGLVGLCVAFVFAAIHRKQKYVVASVPPAANFAFTNRSGTYEQGFADGMNATIKHIQFNTNTGKFTLEMTNVLNEMKP